MATLSLPFPSGRGAQSGAVARLLSNLITGIRDGIRAAWKYEALAVKSDEELARYGLKREDLPRVIIFGRV